MARIGILCEHLLGQRRQPVEPLAEEDGVIDYPDDQRNNPWAVALDHLALHMRLKCGCVHVGLMGVKVIRRGFVLDDIETEGARFFANACAEEFAIERDELVHVLRLDGDVCQYAVHCILLGWWSAVFVLLSPN